MTAQPIRSTHVLILYSLLAISVLVIGGCASPSGPQRRVFSQGIRVHQDEAITQNGVRVPLPRCQAGGDWLGQVGGPSPNSGSVVRFVGRTDQFGDFDEEDAIDNANWSVFSGPAQAPPCPRATVQRFVPPGGAIFNFICVAAGA